MNAEIDSDRRRDYLDGFCHSIVLETVVEAVDGKRSRKSTAFTLAVLCRAGDGKGDRHLASDISDREVPDQRQLAASLLHTRGAEDDFRILPGIEEVITAQMASTT